MQKNVFSRTVDSIAMMAVAGLLNTANLVSRRELDSRSIVLKQEVKSVLKKYSLYDAFVEGKLKCFVCSVPMNFDNLGFIEESDDLKLICRDPGCSLKRTHDNRR